MTAPEQLRLALRERYRLERELGQGGMATVYLARDLKHDRDVAIKVLHPDIAESLGRERFVREIRLAARLTHPHILPVFDSGEVEGVLYYTMPVMQGETLRARLAAGVLPVDEAVRITCEVADALDYAHRNDVVHRDIKPENILLHEGHALVADFGIGKAMAAAGGEAMGTHTIAGIALGTPAYMSPEQASGDEVDGRSDLFSLGCTLYEMLTGEQPFTGPTVQAVIARRFTYVPPSVTAQRPAIPEGVSRAVDKLMARLPDERLTSGAQVVRALRGEVMLPSRVEPASVAVLPFANMSADPENAFFSDGITDDIIAALTKVKGLKVAARASAFTFRGPDVDLAAVGAKLGVQHVLQGSVRRAGNRVRVTAQLMTATDGAQLWGERWDRELDDIFAIQDEIARAIVDELQVRLGASTAPTTPLVVRPTDDLEAYELYLRGREAIRRRTPSGVERGVELMLAANARDPRFAAPYTGLVEGYVVMGVFGFRAMREVTPKALDAVAQLAALGASPTEIAIQRALVDITTSDRWVEAGEVLRVAAGAGTRDPFLLAYVAQWHSMRHDVNGCRVAVERLIEADPLSAWSRAVAALALVTVGDHERGITEATEGVRLDPLHSYAAFVHAVALDRCGRHAEAIANARRGLALMEGAPFGQGVLALMLAGGGERAECAAIADAICAEHPTHVIGLIYASLRLGGERLERAVDRACALGASPIGTVPIRQELDSFLDHPTIGPKLREIAFYKGLERRGGNGPR